MKGLRLGLGLTGSSRPELVTNGTFDTDTSGWSTSNATLSVVSGKMRVTNSIAAFGGAYQTIPTVIGQSYRVQVTGTVVSAGTPIIRVGNTGFGASEYADVTSTALDTTFTATTTSTTISVFPGSGTAGQASDFDNISLR